MVDHSRGIGAWGLFGAIGLLVAVGCQPTQNTPKSSSQNAKAVDPSGPPPLLKGWDKPAAVLMLSGEQHGYFEPCGCSLTQSGGMARRADLTKQLQDRDWPVAGLDVGGLLKRSRRQDQIKFETIWNALKTLDYEAVAVGVEDLRIGADFLVSQQPSDPAAIAEGPALISANLTFFEVPDLGTPIRTKVFQVGEIKVGVTAVFGQSLKDEVAPQGVQSNVQVTETDAGITAALETLTAEKPDLLVLLSHGSREEASALAEKYPQFPVVVAAGGPEEPASDPKRVGKTLVIETGHKGKKVGLLGVYPGEELKLRYELVDLDNRRFKTDPRMLTAMRDYQQRLQDEGLAESSDLNIRHPSNTGFVGAAKCGECHTKAYAKWKTSKHAHAFDSLQIGRKGEEATWVSRIYDPECLACHVTGWDPQGVLRYEGGFVSLDKTPHLAGQQCENCHGPGQRHTELEEQHKKNRTSVPFETVAAARREVKRDWKQAEKQVCHKCHDVDNSPGFNFNEYWSKVQHPGRD